MQMTHVILWLFPWPDRLFVQHYHPFLFLDVPPKEFESCDSRNQTTKLQVWRLSRQIFSSVLGCLRFVVNLVFIAMWFPTRREKLKTIRMWSFLMMVFSGLVMVFTIGYAQAGYWTGHSGIRTVVQDSDVLPVLPDPVQEAAINCVQRWTEK